jgi:hypothetical protein
MDNVLSILGITSTFNNSERKLETINVSKFNKESYSENKESYGNIQSKKINFSKLDTDLNIKKLNLNEIKSTILNLEESKLGKSKEESKNEKLKDLEKNDDEEFE